MQRQVAEFPMDFVGGLVSSDLSSGEHQTPERLSRGLGIGVEAFEVVLSAASSLNVAYLKGFPWVQAIMIVKRLTLPPCALPSKLSGWLGWQCSFLYM